MRTKWVTKVRLGTVVGGLLFLSWALVVAVASPAQNPFTAIEDKLDKILAALFFSDPRGITPNWDKKLNSTNGGPDGCDSDRFTCIFGGEAVRDNETGLVWDRTPSDLRYTWAVARVVCLNETAGGRKGWRLPSVHELASLIDTTKPVPTLPMSHPFIVNLFSVSWWSASLSADNPLAAWHVQLDNGLVSNIGRDTTLGVWCVRSSANAVPY
jgi:hypothetical protein